MLSYGAGGCPFTCSSYRGEVSYEKGICPVTERMYERELLITNVCHANVGREDLDDVQAAFRKVLEQAAALRDGAAV